MKGERCTFVGFHNGVCSGSEEAYPVGWVGNLPICVTRKEPPKPPSLLGVAPIASILQSYSTTKKPPKNTGARHATASSWEQIRPDEECLVFMILLYIWNIKKFPILLQK